MNEELKFLCKFKKKNGGRGSGARGRVWGVGQGGCDQRIEVFRKIHQKKIRGGSVGGVRVGGSGWM